ncbi:helix-turn-helix transcriptional regulator [Amaricoccus sp. B4]|uniref:helix-turn-helix transcriptional regulator n=1 Tax=Amaricoccus sp. B4 TaxID=3368557 RepID=UPI00371F9326
MPDANDFGIEPTRLYRRPAVEAATTLSRSQIYLLMDAGDFPRPLRLGPRCVAWKGKDLLSWLESREVSDPRSHGVSR